MRMSESFCKEQEYLQLIKAAKEPLENRKLIALTAAKAWAKEAIAAHKRDNKQTSLDRLDAKITQEFANETAETMSG